MTVTLGEDYGKWNYAPCQGVRVLILGTCECYLMWQKRLCRCDKVKGLGMRDHPGLAVGPVSSKGPHEMEAEGSDERERRRGDVSRSRERFEDLMCLEDAKRGQEPRNRTLEAGKGKEKDYP